MANNSRELKVISTASEKKPNPYRQDVIVDPAGQWKHPGKVTKIPSGDITMMGVPYPVFGVDNFGNAQIMYPDMNYQFPGSSVTEYPIMQQGGWLDNLKFGGYPSDTKARSKRKTTSKNIQSSINKLMLRNEDLFGPSGKRVYKPEPSRWLDKYK